MAFKEEGYEESYQLPQLRDASLQWRVFEQQHALCQKDELGLPALRLEVFDVVRLVQYEVDPHMAAQDEVS